MHLYPATSSMQVPWFRHGLEAHSLMLVWQFGPVGHKLHTLHSPCTFHWCTWLTQFITETLTRAAQILTGEAHTAGADISAGHVLAGPSVHTWVGLTLIIVDIAVFAAPAGVTEAFVAVEETR